MTQYEIRAGKNAPCELIAVEKDGTERFICDGTHTQCNRVLVELALDRPRITVY